VINIKSRIQNSGLSLQKLAKASGLSIERLELLAEGAEPSLAELRKLAFALKMPTSDLISKTENEDKAEFLFRQKLPKMDRDQIPIITKLSRFISHSLDFLPQEDSPPSWIESFHIRETTHQEAERLARLFRDRFYDGDQFGPLLTLPKIAVEKLNIILLVVPEQDVDGASALISGHFFIFISPRFPGRMLFTLAHEIGHCAAHLNGDNEYAIVDGLNQVGKVYRRIQDQEGLADAFASCLLLPSGGVALALRKIREVTKTSSNESIGDVHILYLSRIFGVSFEVAARRCEDLELLPRGGAYSLYDKLKKEFGSPEKRAEAVGLPPRPQIEFPRVPVKLLNAAIEKIKSGEMSIGRASNYLSLSISDLFKAHAASAK
jgi:Zn-dependent peptidase ImmA (M78 family)/transcriptional regulator with XRE-family HTH domain